MILPLIYRQVFRAELGMEAWFSSGYVKEIIMVVTRGLLLLIALLVAAGCATTSTQTESEIGVTQNTGEAKKYYNIGYEYLKNRLYADAITNFKRAIADSSTYVDAYVALAQAYEAQGDLEMVRKSFEEAKKAIPGSPAPCVGMGHCLVGMGRYDEAISEYEEALRRAPSDPAVLEGAGVLRQGSGARSGQRADALRTG
jgi:Tfp pilus assembly protein PilF